MGKIRLPVGTIVPDHIAVILDGNGRWARSRGLPATKGHEAGAKALSEVIRAARKLGVHTLTVWGFSTENWKRPPAERRKIFEIIAELLEKEIKSAKEEGARLIHLGRKDRLPNKLLEAIFKAEEETRHNTKYILNLALDYGGRDELLRAVRGVVRDGVPAEDIDEELFSSYLDTAGQPYPCPDLFIRTSGELRTSGYLPWQTAYSELYFMEDHLPDMKPENLKKAILDFSHRRRRVGGKDRVKHFTFKPEIAARLELDWWRLSKIPEDKTFTQYTVDHLQEVWGLSTKHATNAAKCMALAVLFGNKKNWKSATKSMKEFYELLRGEVKLAFEPSIAAGLQVRLWREMQAGHRVDTTSEIEETIREHLSEVYRISEFQAAKAAHLKALATAERSLAENALNSSNRDIHWSRAADYLEKYYRALKDRVA